MGVVAVAGGTGDVGRTITEQLAESGKHTVYILSRKEGDSPIPGTKLLVIDYSDADAIAATLDAKAVDTVISALGLAGGEGQLKLIAGAKKAPSTRRFIPSEYAAYTPPDAEENEFTTDVLRAVDALRGSGLQYTRFAIGIFMDYFGIPNIPSHLSPFVWVLTLLNAVLQYLDAARFIERLLEDGDWPEYSIISGSDTSFTQILALAQEYTGKYRRELQKENKRMTSPQRKEKLEKNEATLLDDSSYGGMDPRMMRSTIGLQLIKGDLELPKEGRLNDRYPEIKPMTIAELIAKAWKKG
uniref:NAD(P)-binding domain-containing protein n=1 Tax=Bionectria ochroleuca TaxID=29856 RepID=A0A0B7KC18_BIOOC